MIKATWRRSAIGFNVETKATIHSLGFRKLQQTRELPETDAVRGMLRRVSFLVEVEGETFPTPKRARYKIPRARSNKKHSRGR
jgi:large subunit ribosomal protein L30